MNPRLLPTVVGGLLLMACGAAQAPPPCTVSTILIPEEEMLRRVVYHYDDQHLISTSTYVGDADEPFERIENVYDTNGGLLGQNVHSVDDDGVAVESSLSYERDEGGRVIAEEWLVGDVVDRREELRYDSGGRVIEETHLAQGEGPELEVQRVVTYSYNAMGNIASQETDEGGDGLVESTIVFTYRDDGQPLTEDVRNLDQPRLLTRYIYDDSGRLVAEEDDVGANGTVELVKRYIYQAEGEQLGEGARLVGIEIDEGNDGTTEHRVEYAYDEQGRLSQEVSLFRDRGDEVTASTRVSSTRTEYDYSCWD